MNLKIQSVLHMITKMNVILLTLSSCIDIYTPLKDLNSLKKIVKVKYDCLKATGRFDRLIFTVK